MLQEKDMVNDVLSMTKAGMSNYTVAIGECCDQNLRSTLQQMRAGDEKFQYDLYKIAEQKGYYQPAQKADDQEVQNLKSQLSQGMNQTDTMNINMR